MLNLRSATQIDERLYSGNVVIHNKQFTDIIQSQDSLKSANEEAQRILSEAHKRAASIKRAARNSYKKAKQKGFLNGLKNANNDAIIRNISIAKDISKYIHKVEIDVANLVFEVLSQYIGSMASHDKITGLVQGAIAEYGETNIISILIHPDNFEYVIDQFCSYSDTLNIEESGAIDKDAVTITLPFGIIEISFEEFISKIAKALR